MKYQLTNNIKIVNNTSLFQIKALKSFNGVLINQLGGWIESENNLSQFNNCWIYDNTLVSGNAFIQDNAQIYGNAKISGNSHIYGNAKVSGHSLVYGNAQIFDNAIIYDHAMIYDNARVFGNASISGGAHVFNHAHVYDNAIASQKQYIRYSNVTSNIDDLNYKIENIEAQTSLKTYNNEVYCYIHTNKFFESLNDTSQTFEVNTTKEVTQPNYIMVSNPQYHTNATHILFCKININDIISIQEGNIKCSKVFIIGISDEQPQ